MTHVGVCSVAQCVHEIALVMEKRRRRLEVDRHAEVGALSHREQGAKVAIGLVARTQPRFDEGIDNSERPSGSGKL